MEVFMNKKTAGVIFVSAIMSLILFISVGNAQTVPAAQELGFPDVKYISLKKEICQDCHGESLVDAHHVTQQALAGQCASCHTVNTAPEKMGVLLVRDCMQCHMETPHNKTKYG